MLIENESPAVYATGSITLGADVSYLFTLMIDAIANGTTTLPVDCTARPSKVRLGTIINFGIFAAPN